jgi:hypothetical protein
MKLHRLLQKCSFFFRFDWTLAASGGARMKLVPFREIDVGQASEPQNF